MRELCLPVALNIDQMKEFDRLVKKRDTLYRVGDAFQALYAVRCGSLKTTVLAEDGREQVLGYHMLGEIIGFDGIGPSSSCPFCQGRARDRSTNA